MLEEIRIHPETLDEFVEMWLQQRVVYREDKITTKVLSNGKVVKYHPVHPIGSPNRVFFEKKMKEDLEYLITKYKN